MFRWANAGEARGGQLAELARWWDADYMRTRGEGWQSTEASLARPKATEAAGSCPQPSGATSAPGPGPS